MTDGVLLAALGLAAYRLFRLLAVDGITERPRAAVERTITAKVGGKWAGGLTCGWCLGSWCAVAVVGIVWGLVGLALPALWIGATATLVGLLANWLGD